MRKYTKKELVNIFTEVKKYSLWGLVLKNVSKDSFQVQKILKTQNIWDLDLILWVLSPMEQNILEMNVSALIQKFLKDYKKLWVQAKKQFKNLEEVLQLQWENMQKNLK